MTTQELFDELRRLNRADKLRAMQVLVTELATEEDALLIPNASYEIWSPYDATDAAQTLLDMLEADKNA
ncbi:MAG: hypothetical protein GC204_12320 [Chloroflexi bacterium]|nr:hypothetical protein [Chloroflexota bacterium]